MGSKLYSNIDHRSVILGIHVSLKLYVLLLQIHVNEAIEHNGEKGLYSISVKDGHFINKWQLSPLNCFFIGQ